MNIQELIESLQAGIEGVTPGPWHVPPEQLCGDGKRVVDEEMRFIAFSGAYRRGNPKRFIEAEEAAANAAHIARCSPENIAAIIAYIHEVESSETRSILDLCAKLAEANVEFFSRAQAAEAECKRLREALEPFEEIADEGIDYLGDETKVTIKVGQMVFHAATLGDFRRVRAVVDEFDKLSEARI